MINSMEQNTDIWEKRRKPAVVYHGTSFLNLDEINPSNKRVRDRKEGALVFGAEHKEFASMFLGPRPDDTWSSKGCLNGLYYILIGDEDRYRREDKGGIIYELPGETFEFNPKVGMKTEWVSTKSVIPLNKQIYSSALEAMIENGVQVYFVDKKKLEEFNRLPKDTIVVRKFLESLESENQKR